MHKSKDRALSVDETFMLRVPFLPLSILGEISDTADIETLLRKYYSLPMVARALYLASPDLYDRAREWLGSKGSCSADNSRIRNSLLKYLIRMSSRCTPFGMFAGICSGSLSDETRIEIAAPETHSIFTRPDMHFLCGLASAISGTEKIRRQLFYTVNTSLYRVGDEYRYVEYFVDENGLRSYRLQSTPHTPYLEQVFGRASRPAGIAELVDSLGIFGPDHTEAETYVRMLIDNQVLVSDLEPNVSGTGFFEKILEKTQEAGDDSLMLLSSKLNEIHDHAKGCDPEAGIAGFRSLEREIERMNIPFSRGTLLQADMCISHHHCSLSKDISDSLLDAMPLMMRLASSPGHSLLKNFRENFVRRYDDAEVPLALALDAEAGPGYLPEDIIAGDSSLLHGLRLPAMGKGEKTIHWNDADRMLLRKMQGCLLNGDLEMELTEKDLLSLPGHQHPLPDSFSLMARITGRTTPDSGKPIIQIVSMGGTSCSNLAGRFCNYDDRLRKAIERIHRAEQSLYSDSILAEIVHLPQQRTGNILMRPVLRPYEIPYLASPGVRHDHTIPVTDLMVSVSRDRVLLRSKRLDKFIIPRMSNAHNFSVGSLAVYRFLCDLQAQDVCTMPGFSWNILAQDAVFLPRVTFREFILCPACWNLDQDEVRAFRDARTETERAVTMRTIRSAYSIPRYVLLSHGDNELWLDLENEACVAVLQAEMKGRRDLRLQEWLYEEDMKVVRSRDGGYANEFVLFFYQQEV